MPTDWSNLVHNFDWRVALLLFIAYACVDAIFVLYTLAVTKHQATKAANFSFIYYLVVAVGVIQYVHNILYVLVVASGSWLGTLLVVRREKLKKTS